MPADTLEDSMKRLSFVRDLGHREETSSNIVHKPSSCWRCDFFVLPLQSFLFLIELSVAMLVHYVQWWQLTWTSCSEKTWILDKKSFYLRKSWKHAEMKCPYPLQANQISQCNDFGALPFINFIRAVIKWRCWLGIRTHYSEMEFDSKVSCFLRKTTCWKENFYKVLNRYPE